MRGSGRRWSCFSMAPILRTGTAEELRTKCGSPANLPRGYLIEEQRPHPLSRATQDRVASLVVAEVVAYPKCEARGILINRLADGGLVHSAAILSCALPLLEEDANHCTLRRTPEMERPLLHAKPGEVEGVVDPGTLPRPGYVRLGIDGSMGRASPVLLGDWVRSLSNRFVPVVTQTPAPLPQLLRGREYPLGHFQGRISISARSEHHRPARPLLKFAKQLPGFDEFISGARHSTESVEDTSGEDDRAAELKEQRVQRGTAERGVIRECQRQHELQLPRRVGKGVLNGGALGDWCIRDEERRGRHLWLIFPLLRRLVCNAEGEYEVCGVRAEQRNELPHSPRQDCSKRAATRLRRRHKVPRDLDQSPLLDRLAGLVLDLDHHPARRDLFLRLGRRPLRALLLASLLACHGHQAYSDSGDSQPPPGRQSGPFRGFAGKLAGGLCRP